MSAFSLARSLVRLFVLFDIYHVNIQLHQSTHCRISMLQTWSLCFGHAYFQVNVNRRERCDVRFIAFQCGRNKVFSIKKFAILFRVSVTVISLSHWLFNCVDSINVLFFSSLDLITFPIDWLTESFIRATFYFLHCRHCHYRPPQPHLNTEKANNLI